MNKVGLLAGVAMLVALAPAQAGNAIDAGVLICKSWTTEAFGGWWSGGDVLNCVVRGWGKTVDVTIDTNSTEARQICYSAAFILSQKTDSFSGRKWQLQIFSPYADRPIASCPLH